MEEFLETLGSPLMAPGGPVISAMAGLAGALGSLGAAAGRNSEAIKAIVDIIGNIAIDRHQDRRPRLARDRGDHRHWHRF